MLAVLHQSTIDNSRSNTSIQILKINYIIFRAISRMIEKYLNIKLSFKREYLLCLINLCKHVKEKRDCKGHAFRINDGIFLRRMSYTYSDSIKKLQPQSTLSYSCWFANKVLKCQGNIRVVLQIMLKFVTDKECKIYVQNIVPCVLIIMNPLDKDLYKCCITSSNEIHSIYEEDK